MDSLRAFFTVKDVACAGFSAGSLEAKRRMSGHPPALSHGNWLDRLHLAEMGRPALLEQKACAAWASTMAGQDLYPYRRNDGIDPIRTLSV